MKREKKEQVLRVLAGKIRDILLKEAIPFDEMQEIRLRKGQPLAVWVSGKEQQFSHKITGEELRETMEYISGYSLYAYENDLRQGFLTIDGGHRVGVSGKIIPENGHVKNFQYISSVNIRISHEIYGCADQVFPEILEDGKLCHTLILSPPGCGKTTLLRDLVRQISDGNPYLAGENVGVVDERSEIGGCYQGVPQNQLGRRTDILDGCPKAEGMMMLIRSMSPKVVAVDEIGTEDDVEALRYAMHCGATVVATAHGNSFEELSGKALMASLIKDQEFKRYIILGKEGEKGRIQTVLDERGRSVCT